MVGGLSRMFRIFNGRIKEGRIGEGEKVFYLGAIKGVGGLPKWSNASRFRVRRRRRSFVIQRDFSSESKIVVPWDGSIFTSVSNSWRNEARLNLLTDDEFRSSSVERNLPESFANEREESRSVVALDWTETWPKSLLARWVRRVLANWQSDRLRVKLCNWIYSTARVVWLSLIKVEILLYFCHDVNLLVQSLYDPCIDKLGTATTRGLDCEAWSNRIYARINFPCWFNGKISDTIPPFNFPGTAATIRLLHNPNLLLLGRANWQQNRDNSTVKYITKLSTALFLQQSRIEQTVTW